MKKIIYINISAINNYNDVLNGLLSKIDDSGLYDEAYMIFLIANGDNVKLEIDGKSKYQVWRATNHTDNVEFPSLNLLWYHTKEILDEDYNILYLHTKGVTKLNNKPVKDWVNYLSYFNITKWKDRVEELKTNDTTGVNFSGKKEDYNEHPSTWGYGKAPLHYSGNFWWAKSSYIRTLNNPYEWTPDNNYLKWRVMCEMWLCQNNGKFNNAYSSNVNHYSTEYPSSNYII